MADGGDVSTCLSPADVRETDKWEPVGQRTCKRLEADNRKAYAIPVGGSNGLGSWGYIEAIDELNTQIQVRSRARERTRERDGGSPHCVCRLCRTVQQEQALGITDVAFACGSGGTAAGIGLGSYLYAQNTAGASVRFTNQAPGTP